MGKWRFDIKVESKLRRNTNTQSSNRLGIFKKRLRPFGKQRITSLLKLHASHSATLSPSRVHPNAALKTAAELQKCNGLLYANIKKIR